MAIVTTDDRHYKDIADTLREYAGEGLEEDFGTDKMLPSEMAERAGYAIERWGSISYGEGMDEGFSEGYSTGHAEGFSEGYDVGYEEGGEEAFNNGHEAGFIEGREYGKQAEYDRFWDAFQPSEVDTYRYKFNGNGWTPETFRPKRSIRPTAANQMFMYSEKLNISLPDTLEALGLEMDFSNCTTFPEMLLYSAITEIGTVDTRKATNIYYIFRYARSLVTVQNLIMKDDESQYANNTSFQYMDALENLTVTGVFGKNCGGMDFSSSTKLSKASITSVVNALSSTTSGLSVTFSKTAVNNAFSGGSTGAEWTALANTKSNWTINLV